MEQGAGQPKYRIQRVAEMTGVPTATLRAWERRYGVPRPSRTQTRYRLYGDDDVQVVKAMQKLIGSGLSAAEAARVARETAGELEPELELPGEGGDDRDPYGTLTNRLVEAATAMSADDLRACLRLATTLAPAATVFERVLAPAQRRIGELWHAGTLSVAHEHLASELIGTTARSLLTLVQPRAPERTVLLACFADEEHWLPLYGVAFAFVERGFAVHVLGARTPPLALETAVERLQPDAVGLSVTTAPRRERARELLEAYRVACRGRPWLVGGLAASELTDLAEAAGAQVVTDGPRAVADAIAKL